MIDVIQLGIAIWTIVILIRIETKLHIDGKEN